MLYNTHLETLIQVVEAGSFRKAAEVIGISPSAVLKQITLLEEDLKVSVFDRSRKGVTLTEAGESVYRDAKYIIRYCGSAAERARELHTRERKVVRIGVSPMNPVEGLVALWPEIHRRCPDIRCQYVTFENSACGMERTFSTIGQDCDLILGVYDEGFLNRYGLGAVHLADVPAVIACAPELLPGQDPERALEVEELLGKTVLLPEKGVFAAADAFRRDAEEKYAGIRLESFEIYSLDLFYDCQSCDKLIMTYDIWEMGHLLLDTKSVKWPYASSYGILSARDPSENVARLLDAAREALRAR